MVTKYLDWRIGRLLLAACTVVLALSLGACGSSSSSDGGTSSSSSSSSSSTSSGSAVTITSDPTDLSGRGLWGSLVISGYGMVNTADGNHQTTSEAVPDGVTRWFGGTNEADSSGTLQYVILAETGEAFRVDEELQGLTVEAAGSGTTIDHLQIVNSDDDGIEWFGGAASVSHVLIEGVTDDGLDIDLGYQGTIQYALVVQGDAHGDHGIESDNNGENFGATPKSSPVIANVTILGNGGNGGDTDANTNGALHREGFGGQVYRSVYTDNSLASAGSKQFDTSCLDLDNEVDEDLFYGDVVFNCAVETFDSDADTFEADFTSGANYDGEVDNSLSINASTLAVTATYTETDYSTQLAAAGLDDNSYVGAVDPAVAAGSTWWDGWALRQDGIEGNLPGGDFHPLEAEIGDGTISPAGTADCASINADFTDGANVDVFGVSFPVCVISENIEADTTLTNDHIYLLDGSINVGDGDVESASDDSTVANVTLTVNAGTQIFGVTGTGPALIITRGSQIQAAGTEAMPIIFGAVDASM